MRVLITGGAGFIGSHITLLLLQSKYDVIVLDSFVNSSVQVIDKIKSFLEFNNSNYSLKTIVGDIRDKDTLNQIFLEAKNEGRAIEAVIHLAGLKSVAHSIDSPSNYWDVNVCGTQNLISTMIRSKCFKIVFSGSATIYGLSDNVPIDENNKISPVNPYGRTKAAIENMLDELYKSNKHSWRICSLRYFNPVGAHSSGVIGEDPIGVPNNLFPFITQVAIGRRSLLKVYGKDWNTKDGSGVRDYIHVMDLSEGHLAALKFLNSKKKCNESINLGSGEGYSVLQIIEEFERTNGCKIPYTITGRRDGDIAISLADITKAKKLLGWAPKKTLKDICRDGWNWQRKNPNGYL